METMKKKDFGDLCVYLLESFFAAVVIAIGIIIIFKAV